MSLSSKRLFQGDLVIWAIYFWLCMISLIEVYSAGSSLSYKSGDFMAPLFKQAIFLGIGTAVVWVIHSIPCRFFKLGVVLYPISIFLLILTLIIGAKENDGARWLNFGIKFQLLKSPRALWSSSWRLSSPSDRRRKGPTKGP